MAYEKAAEINNLGNDQRWFVAVNTQIDRDGCDFGTGFVCGEIDIETVIAVDKCGTVGLYVHFLRFTLLHGA